MPAEEAVDTTTTPIDRAIVLAGGELHTSPIRTPQTIVIAADSGYDHARTLDIAVDILVGDMDSISQAGLDHASEEGVITLSYPTDKDHTDLELALLAAAARGAQHIDIHGGEGGSLGHLLGVALELTDERWNGLTVRWHTQGGIAEVARPDAPVTIHGMPGDDVSLIPIGTADGIHTSGLAWPLENGRLTAGTTRGLRNRIISSPAEVNLTSGTVIVIWEGAHP